MAAEDFQGLWDGSEQRSVSVEEGPAILRQSVSWRMFRSTQGHRRNNAESMARQVPYVNRITLHCSHTHLSYFPDIGRIIIKKKTHTHTHTHTKFPLCTILHCVAAISTCLTFPNVGKDKSQRYCHKTAKPWTLLLQNHLELLGDLQVDAWGRQKKESETGISPTPSGTRPSSPSLVKLQPASPPRLVGGARMLTCLPKLQKRVYACDRCVVRVDVKDQI